MLNSESLKPIEWRVWAAEVDHGVGKEGGGGGGGGGGKRGEQGALGGEGEFFKGLEKGQRRGFVDIRVRLLD